MAGSSPAMTNEGELRFKPRFVALE
jgi:hypothetical protein